MYFPRNFDLPLSLELAQLISEAYLQFESHEKRASWQLPREYELIGELRYPWKTLASIDIPSRLEGYLKRIPLLEGRAEISVPIGFIAKKRKACYVVFRGTQTVKEWISNLNTKLRRHGIEGFGCVHEGFLTSYEDLQAGLFESLEKIGASAKLFIAGHSLGGAFAALAAIDIEKCLGRRVAALYTFGAPRLGDNDFVRAFNASFSSRSYRVANTSDFVTEVPFPAPIAGFVGGYFSHVDTPVLSTVQLGDIEENHRIETYILSLKQNKKTPLFHR